jgi:translin
VAEGDRGRSGELDALVSAAADELAASHQAREAALRACRATIQASGRSIRATHRHEVSTAVAILGEARRALDDAQQVLTDFPAIAAAGFLHDAEKEYAEAALFAALATEGPLPGHRAVRVAPAAWLNGLAEAGSELRRLILDTLRAGELARAEVLLVVMDEVYGLLVGVDFPDAVTGGLRRTTDGFRAVLERTRSDLTTTLLQSRLQASIDRALATTEWGSR